MMQWQKPSKMDQNVREIENTSYLYCSLEPHSVADVAAKSAHLFCEYRVHKFDLFCSPPPKTWTSDLMAPKTDISSPSCGLLITPIAAKSVHSFTKHRGHEFDSESKLNTKGHIPLF